MPFPSGSQRKYSIPPGLGSCSLPKCRISEPSRRLTQIPYEVLLPCGLPEIIEESQGRQSYQLLTFHASRSPCGERTIPFMSQLGGTANDRLLTVGGLEAGFT